MKGACSRFDQDFPVQSGSVNYCTLRKIGVELINLVFWSRSAQNGNSSETIRVTGLSQNTRFVACTAIAIAAAERPRRKGTERRKQAHHRSSRSLIQVVLLAEMP